MLMGIGYFILLYMYFSISIVCIVCPLLSHRVCVRAMKFSSGRCCCCLRFTSRDPRATKGGSMGYLLLVLIGWMIAVLSVYLSRNSFPTPQPADSTTFSEERARKILLSVQATGESA